MRTQSRKSNAGRAQKVARTLAAGAALALCAGVAVPSHAAEAKGKPGSGGGTTYQVENTYKLPGGHGVAVHDVRNSAGALVQQIYYPADIQSASTTFPVLAWGNGTNALPSDYPGLLNHLASWGFVISASTDPTVATGTEMIDALDHLIAQNDMAGSPFQGRLDLSRIGTIGHSQGAGGTLNTALRFSRTVNGIEVDVDTAVPMNLPDQRYVDEGGNFLDALNPAADYSVFLVGGSSDKLVCPPATLTGYFTSILGNPAAVAALKGASHNTIQRSGGGYLGYITAWMMYQLRDDSVARNAFVGAPGRTAELLTNTGWQNQAVKGLM